MMTTEQDEQEYVLHTVAVFAAREAAGLGFPTQSPGDPWWFEGPHIEKDGRSYYVHAMSCFESRLGAAMRNHPDWYLVAAMVRGRDVELHGLDDHLVTLGEIRAITEALSPDELRLAIALTPRARRKLWGISAPMA
jgi:hypothetical protein